MNGRAFALACAVGYGAALPLSRLVFDDGTNAATVAFLRYAALTLLLAAWVAGTGRRSAPLRLRELALSALLGLAFFGVSIGTLMASAEMPVSLTVVIFYTHPSLILIATALIDRRRPRMVEIGVLGVAFSGLVLALDTTVSGLTATGAALAALSAVSALVSFLIIERLLARADPVRSTAMAALSAAVASGIATWAWGAFALPATTAGWSLLAVVIALFSTAVLCMFLAIRFAGSVRASTMLFLEPVTAVLLAVAILGERLTAVQCIGAALVVGAVAVAGSVSGPEQPTQPRTRAARGARGA